MLQSIGDSLKGNKWLAYLVLIPLVLVFAVWGAAGAVSMDFFGPQTYGVKVNSTKVPLNEVTDAWREQQSQWLQRFGGELPDETRKLLQDNLLESLVRNALVAERTRDMGYRVPEERVREYVENEPAFQLDGKYNEQVAVSRLTQIGVSPERYLRDIRAGLQNAELQRAVQVSEFLTPTERNRLFRIEDEQREVRYALLPAARFAAGVTLDDAAIETYYQQNLPAYTTAESVQLQYAELRLDQVAANVVVGDTDLQDLYAQNRDRYVNPEQRRARHILVASSGSTTDAQALAKAESLLAEARAGKSFEDLARQSSDDSGSAAAGGDLGWSDRSAFVGPFADAVFAMNDDELRGPVKTEFGYHVIRLEGIRPGSVKSFEEARTDLEAEFRRDRAADLFGSRQEAVERRVEAGQGSLDDLVREFGLVAGTAESFGRGSGGAPLGADPLLEDLVFGDAVLNQRRIGGPITLGDDRFVIVRVQQHRKATPKPLAEVRAQVVERLRNERATAAARAAADAAVARLDSGASFEAVAASLALTPEPARFIARGDPAALAQVREVAFDMPRPVAGKPRYRAVSMDQGGAAIVALLQTRIEPPDLSNPQLLATRINQATARAGAASVAAYVEELRRDAKVTKNPAAFDQ